MSVIKLGFDNQPKEIDVLPGYCPHCHKTIIPIYKSGFLSANYSEAVFQCPNSECGSVFIGYYERTPDTVNRSYNHRLTKLSVGNLISIEFTPVIVEVSNQFCNIYNQAFFAEQNNLFDICGVGYRKALEYLIKDYAIKLFPEKIDVIKKIALSEVIKQFIKSQNIKDVATRAAWIGNDETHYIRKWEALDVNHLKKLIDLSVHWIESEELTKSFINEMPETGPK